MSLSRKFKTVSRRKLRIIAMEIVNQKYLYTFDENYYSSLDLNVDEEIFINKLIDLTGIKDNLITEINSYLNEWTYERLGILERSILLLGFQELLNFKDIPINVTIDEWVDISKEYCGEDAKKLINGVLNNFKNKLIKEGNR